MSRLLVHVEGETEEQFVNAILMPHLGARGFASVSARLMGKPRERYRRGGVRPWPGIKREVERHLLGDSGVRSALLVDYYGMPRDWPGRLAAQDLPQTDRAAFVAQKLRESLEPSLRLRFLPCVVMHEFEALIFSDTDAAVRAWGKPELADPMREIRLAFENPEHINDSPLTAPSKRIVKLMPGYEKPLYGALAVLEIGLERIRDECPSFASWLTALEASAGQG